MNQTERRDLQIPYISDDKIFEEQKRARKLTQALNTADRSDFETLGRIVKELLGKSDGAFINPPFYCDYGTHIEVGKISLPIITARFWMWQKSSSETTARWHPMLQSIQQDTRCIRIPAIQLMNMVSK